MPAQSYMLQAAEVGKLINLTQPPTGINFLGATCHLLVTDPQSVQKTYLCTNDITNKFAQYVTLGTEFPTAGTYQVQLQYQAFGELYFSPVTPVRVLPNLI